MAQLKAGTTVGGIPVITTAGGVFTGNITAPVLVSNIATGTAPLTVTSTTKVSNLNADFVDGYNLNQDVQTTASPTFAGMSLNGNLFLTSVAPIIQWNESDQAVDEKRWWMVPDGKTMELRTITDAGGTGVTAFRVSRGTGTAVSKVEFPSLPVQASTFTSTVAQGTAPLTVTSTTAVTNLNADLLDGYHGVTAATASTIAVRDSNADITSKRFISTQVQGTAPFNVASTTVVTNLNADMVDGFHLDQNVSTTSSPLFTNNVNLMFNVTSGVGYMIDGNLVIGIYNNDDTLYINTYLDGADKAQNYGKTIVYGNFESTATLKGAQLQSTVATGTAPLIVASTTMVANLNAQYVNGVTSSTTSVASTVPVRDTTKKIAEVAATRANVSDLQLTTTAQTTVASYTTTSKGNYTARVYLRLATPANVTVYVKYTDATGAQTITVLNNEYLPMDSYTFPPYFFNATSGTTISVLVTSNVVNVVYVSAVIREE